MCGVQGKGQREGKDSGSYTLQTGKWKECLWAYTECSHLPGREQLQQCKGHEGGKEVEREREILPRRLKRQFQKGKRYVRVHRLLLLWDLLHMHLPWCCLGIEVKSLEDAPPGVPLLCPLPPHGSHTPSRSATVPPILPSLLLSPVPAIIL